MSDDLRKVAREYLKNWNEAELQQLIKALRVSKKKRAKVGKKKPKK